MRCDDGRCHICRREPLEEDQRYSITTCLRCADLDDTEPGIVRARRQTERKEAIYRETVFSRFVVQAFLDALAAGVVIFFAVAQAVDIAEGRAPWAVWLLFVALVWAAHAIIKPRVL